MVPGNTVTAHRTVGNSGGSLSTGLLSQSTSVYWFLLKSPIKLIACSARLSPKYINLWVRGSWFTTVEWVSLMMTTWFTTVEWVRQMMTTWFTTVEWVRLMMTTWFTTVKWVEPGHLNNYLGHLRISFINSNFVKQTVTGASHSTKYHTDPQQS